MLNLFVLRHGEASYAAPSDDERELTRAGISQTGDIIVQQKDCIPDDVVVFSSPLIRARQTADIVCKLCSLKAPTIWDDLRPEGNPERLYSKLQQLDANNILLVSHQPLVGSLINNLAALAPGQYRMGTSALACLSGDDILPACLDLQWLRQPSDSP